MSEKLTKKDIQDMINQILVKMQNIPDMEEDCQYEDKWDDEAEDYVLNPNYIGRMSEDEAFVVKTKYFLQRIVNQRLEEIWDDYELSYNM